MTLALSVGAARRREADDPTPRDIDRLDALALDWSRSTTILHISQIPGCTALREQDDVIYDPTQPPERRYAIYVTAQFPEQLWEIWVVYSGDGVNWGAPLRCTLATGGALLGQDPSVVLTLDPARPVVHYDEDDRMWMYLENHPDPTNHSTHAYSSLDGLEWTLEMLNVIPNGETGTWDANTGSPNARYVNGQYVVGFEGFGTSGLGERWGIAYGSTPTALTKSAANPLISGASHGISASCFMDSWWLSKDGSRIMLTGHSGVNGPTYMPRFYTENTDPVTWQPTDFIYIGDTSASIRNDLTAHVLGDRLVTAPSHDQSLACIPLA